MKILSLDICSKSLCVIAFSLLFFCDSANGQAKVELDLKIQAGSDTARGGETFSYSITASNLGTQPANDVIVINDELRSGKFVSGVPSQGTCEVAEIHYQSALRCYLGNLESGGSVLILVETKLNEFGGESPDTAVMVDDPWGDDGSMSANKGTLEDISKPKTSEKGNSANDILYPLVWAYISSEDKDEQEDNNRTYLAVRLLPSKNLPPRINIISPKADFVLTKAVNRKTELPIEFAVVDPDGSIKRVTASDNQSHPFQYVIEEGETKFDFNGRKFTKEELEEASKDQDFIDSLRPVVTPHAKDTYRFIVKNFIYGQNHVHIEAHDNGGRVQWKTFAFEMKSGSEMKMTLRGGSVVAPGTPIVVETETTVPAGVVPKVKLHGTDPQSWTNPVEMNQFSRLGIKYKHRFIFRPPLEGTYELRSVLEENGEFTNVNAFERVVVAHPRNIKITSIKDGQDCTETEPCRIEVTARDTNGADIRDELQILVDGKEYGSIMSSDCQMCAPKSVTLKTPYVQKGIRKIQIVAKHPYGPELGRSGIYTLNFK